MLSCCNIKYNSCTKGLPSFKVSERSRFIVLSLKIIMDLLGISAGVAELADALGLGPSGRKAVGVQVPSPAPFNHTVSPLFWAYQVAKQAIATASIIVLESRP